MSLPPGWTRYTTDDGKEYFHNAVENQTTWDRPTWPEAQADTSDVYQYKPSTLDLDGPSLTEGTPLKDDPTLGFGGAGGGSVGSSGGAANLTDSELVSLRQAPAGQISGGSMSSSTTAPSMSGSSVGSASGGSGGGGAAYGFGQGIGGLMSAATSDDGPGVTGIFGGMLASAQTLFDVGTDDVVHRLKAALLPHKALAAAESGANEFRVRPDFWGPFWVATTAVLFLAATGNFARLLETGDHDKFTADYGLVSLAASMIYGCLVGVPLVARAALWATGFAADSINFKQLICVYGYSLTSIIPVSILCLAPMDSLRWLFTLLGLGISLFFIRSNLWADISVEQPSLKWTMVGLLCGSLVVIYGTYRMHFFSSA
eukprot:TRINITY_DN24708_c0_g1_i1.p1 TRINITY_DN24708_c0_g1~~TRINITY_DN24708_c0_g1_i1.p1  ORF type:complete len:372 (+),score=56.06 TRINITY_DN24708_c0_g1_i1:146-1261(+)